MTETDPIEDQELPLRRTSSRLQAAKVTQRLPNADQQLTTRNRSRSRSIGRDKKAEISPVIEEISEISANRENSPARRSVRSRSNTPTRVMPPRAAKSPSRQVPSNTMTPVKLTRSARKRGLCTPKEEEVAVRFIINESPVQSPEKVEEASAEIANKTAGRKKRDRHSIGAFLRNWKGAEQDEVTDQEVEDMDISKAEFIEVEKEEQNPRNERSFTKEETPKKAKSPKNVETTKLIEADSKKEEQSPKKERNFPKKTKSPKNFETSETRVETIKLCVERTLNVVYTHQPEELETTKKDIQERVPAKEELTHSGNTSSDEECLIEEIEQVEESEEVDEIRQIEEIEEKVADDSLCYSIESASEADEIEPEKVGSIPPEEANTIEQGSNHSLLTFEEKSLGNIPESEKNKLSNMEEELPTRDTESREETCPDKLIEEVIEKGSIAEEVQEIAVKKEEKKKRKTKIPSPEVELIAVKSEPKKKKKMTVVDEDGTLIFPEVSMKRMFSEPKKCSKDLKNLLQNLYKWSNTERRSDDLPDIFLNDNSETLWQFVAHKNKQINKDWRKFNYLLEEPIAAPEISNSLERESVLDEEEDEADLIDEEVADDDVEEEDVDLFNLNDEDLKDLEAELEKERAQQGSSREIQEKEKPQKRFKKSAVDDKFFNLDEMNAFCDEAEKQNGDGLGILDTADDSWGGPADYRYEDFFGKLDDLVGDDDRQRDEMPKKRKAVEDINLNKKKKTVRFAMDEGKENNGEIRNIKLLKENKILLGQKTEVAESKLKTDIRKLKESIRKLEEENLQPRSWELSGEVAADQRDENALLESHIQFDNNKKRAPEITEDFTEKLEALIKQRIKDQAFDDVVRIKKVDEKIEAYRNDAIEEQEFMKKSLSEVYEKEYQKAAGETEKISKENSTHKNIEEKMNKLFTMLDAMSHFEYTPPTVRPEITVISNMAALRAEEVGMQASTDAQLLAPEEMRKKIKGELKADDERTKTDKLRERRKKKIKQRSMILKVGEEKALPGQMEKKKKKNAEGKGDQLKSSNFFTKLQDTVQNEIREKTTKKKKVKSEKVTSGGSKFKL